MSLSQLEIFYDFEPKQHNLIDRKFQIKDKKLIIFAPKQSGVTSLLYLHLSSRKKGTFLYIDFNDLRIDRKNIKDNLNRFLKYHRITLLILDNFDFSFKVPVCEEVILTSNFEKYLDGYTTKKFYPLDFEEFIAFEKRHTSIEQIFNIFTNTGTYPKISLSSDINKTILVQQTISNILRNDKELEIFKKISQFQSKKISKFEIFKELKTDLKLSKDIFYKIISYFQDTNLLIFLEKFNQPKATKKIFLIDFTLKNALSFQKDFIKKFDNIVFLELYKKMSDIYYTEEINFYLPKENTAILCIPFLPVNLLKNKIVKRKKHFKKLGVKKVDIISIGNEAQFSDNNISYQVIPFWNWANSLS